ncbi:MAG: hypothetical protein WEA58_04140 [Balneolaceae bacterium]
MDLHKPNNGQPNTTVEVTADDLTFQKCECESQTFITAHKIGVLSVIHPKNNTGKKQHVSVPVAVCTNCNEIFEG